jgi:hypothetical protein
MPIISRFLGITIVMFYADHQPAHFHARLAMRRCWWRLILGRCMERSRLEPCDWFLNGEACTSRSCRRIGNAAWP